VQPISDKEKHTLKNPEMQFMQRVAVYSNA